MDNQHPSLQFTVERFNDFNTSFSKRKLESLLREHCVQINMLKGTVQRNGSSGYVMSATPSVTPIKQVIEERTYGNSKTYYPMPKTDEFGFMYETTYDMNNFHIIDAIATIQKHVDQGISFEMGVTSDVTTRDLQRYWLYAQHKGIKTLYYTRTKKLSVDECLSCSV